MSNPLFRESALQNLSSPEQLDQLIRITRPRAWIVLITLGFLLAAVLLWSVFGSLPTSISGQGIVIGKGGTYNIVSLGGGVVTEFEDFQTGQAIKKGQLLGKVAQPVMELQRDAALGEMLRLEREQASIFAEIAKEEPEKNKSAVQQVAIQQASIAAREQILASLKFKLAKQEALLIDGLITQQRFEETRQAIYTAENDIGNARNTLQTIGIQSITNKSGYEERSRRINASLQLARNRYDETVAQHDLASRLISPHDGTVVELLVSRGDTVTTNQPVLSVETAGDALEAVIYMPPLSEAKLIRPGMSVQLSPATARKERYGYLVGKVTAISKYPSTEQGMQAVFNNMGLVRELSKSGPPVAVSVELVRDRSTKSGYQWSSSAGSGLDLDSGTLAAASFTIEVQRPISLVIPLLRQTVGL